MMEARVQPDLDIPDTLAFNADGPVAPRISVVVPAYNAERTIERTLHSIFDQTLPADEILVVDDGSRDSTADVTRRYAPRVTLIQQANAGPSAARNHGVRRARNEWVALLDSDDAWLPNKLERQAAQFAEDVGLVHCYCTDEVHTTDLDVTFDRLWDENFIGTSTVIFRKSLFERIGGFEEAREFIGAEDYNFWLRLAATGARIATVREELSLYTPAENSLSQNAARVIRAELLNVDRLGQQFQLPPERVRSKRRAILTEYAKALFWQRDLIAARGYFAELLHDQPTAYALIHWLATFLPPVVLNSRRKGSAPTWAVAK